MPVPGSSHHQVRALIVQQGDARAVRVTYERAS